MARAILELKEEVGRKVWGLIQTFLWTLLGLVEAFRRSDDYLELARFFDDQ